MERSPLHAMLERHLGPGAILGAVALVDHAGDCERVAAGQVDTEGTAPMSGD